MKLLAKILLFPYIVAYAFLVATVVAFTKMFDDHVDVAFINYPYRFFIWFKVAFWSFYVPNAGYYCKISHDRQHWSEFKWYWRQPKNLNRWATMEQWDFVS